MQNSRLQSTFAVPTVTIILVCGLVVLRTGDAEEPRDSRLRDMLVINEDNSYFYSSSQPEQMNQKGLHAWVDQYAGGTVTHLFICPNAMRASFEATHVTPFPAESRAVDTPSWKTAVAAGSIACRECWYDRRTKTPAVP